MRGMGILVVLLLAVSVLPDQGAGQEGQERRILGPNRKVIPGEALGALRLGLPRAEIEKTFRLGAAAQSGVAQWPYIWNWPTAGFGKVDFWVSEAVELGTCTSNGRVFYAGATLVREEAPDARWLNAKVMEITVMPEGVGLRAGHRRFQQLFGEPVATLKDLGWPGATVMLFPNGVVLKVNLAVNFPFGIGTYNIDVCK